MFPPQLEFDKLGDNVKLSTLLTGAQSDVSHQQVAHIDILGADESTAKYSSITIQQLNRKRAQIQK